jgi:hypothetical protein
LILKVLSKFLCIKKSEKNKKKAHCGFKTMLKTGDLKVEERFGRRLKEISF